MSGRRETAALIALLRRCTVPRARAADLVEERGGALALLDEVAGAQENLLDPPPEEELRAADEDLRRWEAEGIRVLSVLDGDYPTNLRTVHDRPPLLFVAGRLVPADGRSVAVIGSRAASPTGLQVAGAISEHLVALEYTVISGLAAGIDTAAHAAALGAGGRTVAVAGTGLHHSYPPENAELQRRLIAESAVVSQFWPETPPSRRTFPARNAVMSGLARANVIVEASHRSGARTQARLALAHGRPVVLWRPLLSQTWARDLARLPGTHIAASPREVTDLVERLQDEGAPQG